MTSLSQLFSASERGVVVAPAGCGKTQLIAEAVSLASSGRALILTHTHAGIHALRSRLGKLRVDPDRYRVETIAGWALRYAIAFPMRSGVADGQPRENHHWNTIYTGAAKLLDISAIRRVVERSYTCLYVDEYQDCILEQHALILRLAEILPCRVVGDPLQGIFDFGGQHIVDWPTDVYNSFELLGKLREPWRWKKENVDLGNWTIAIHDILEKGGEIDLRNAPLVWRKKERVEQRAACTAALRERNSSIVAIHNVKQVCHSWARSMPGFSSDEEMESEHLFTTAKEFDQKTGTDLASAVIEFASTCMTQVSSELRTFRLALDAGRVPTAKSNSKHERVKEPLRAVVQGDDQAAIANALHHIDNMSGCRVYKPEVWREMRRAAKTQAEGQTESYEEAVRQVRNRTRRLGKRPPRALVSRTHLVKGLEFHHAIMLDAESLNTKNFYVAATRASRSLTICSNEPVLSFPAPGTTL